MFKKLFEKLFKTDDTPITKVDVTVPENCEAIRLPRPSNSVKYGKVAKWHTEIGDTINYGDLLAEIEIDKSVLELAVSVDGKVVYLNPNPKILIGDIIAIIEIR